MNKEDLKKANDLQTQIDALEVKVTTLENAKFIRVHTTPSEFVQFDSDDEKAFIDTIKKHQTDKLAKMKEEFEKIGTE